MGKIISFEKHRDKRQRKRERLKAFECTDNIDTILHYMVSEVSNILDKSDIDTLNEKENIERRKFKKRYSDVLSAAPISNAGRISYFANVMLNLLPLLFHGEYKNRLNSYMDFSEFYLLEFDTAYCQYLNENKEYEKEYPFQFSPLGTDTLEHELQDCLEQIISLSPAINSKEKSKIMWQACRLFELHHILVDLFSGEIRKNNN